MAVINASLERIVDSAETRMKVYLIDFHDNKFFSDISSKIRQNSNVEVKIGDFDSMINKYLSERGIKDASNLKSLSRSQTAILGETYHFVYKFTLKSMDYRNPIPLLKQVFEALKPIDDEYAAKFLYAIGNLMTRDTKKFYGDIPRIVSFFETILPNLLKEYQSGLSQIEKYGGEPEKYNRKKESVDSFYKKSLDMSFELLAGSVKRGVEFGFSSLEEARKSRRIVQDFKTVYYVGNRG